MKTEIDKEKLFRVCGCYRVDSSKALYYKNVIVVPGCNNLYLILDKDCNVINVCEYKNKEGNRYNYFEGVYDIFNDDIISGLKLDPNGNLDSVISLGTIFKITDKYSKFYGGELDSNFTEDEEKIVGYFTLLRHLRGRFLLHYYKMKLQGYSTIDVEEYMKNIISDINDYVKRCLKDNIKPDAHIFRNVTGMGETLFGEMYYLDNTFELLTKYNGYKKTDDAVVELIDDELTSLANLIIQMKNSVNKDILENEPIQMKKKM